MDGMLTNATAVVAIISIILSILALLVNRRKWSRELHARFLEKVIDKRIAAYPDLWRITGTAYKQTSDSDVKDESFGEDWAASILRELSEWYYEKGNGVFMNSDSREAFFKVHRAALKFKSDELSSFRRKITALRIELRRDLKIEDRGTEGMNV